MKSTVDLNVFRQVLIGGALLLAYQRLTARLAAAGSLDESVVDEAENAAIEQIAATPLGEFANEKAAAEVLQEAIRLARGDFARARRMRMPH